METPDMKPKLKMIHGWTLLKNEKDFNLWHEDQAALYATPAPCFPCLVKEVLTSDENTTYEYLTAGMISEMQKALEAT